MVVAVQDEGGGAGGEGGGGGGAHPRIARAGLFQGRRNGAVAQLTRRSRQYNNRGQSRIGSLKRLHQLLVRNPAPAGTVRSRLAAPRHLAAHCSHRRPFITPTAAARARPASPGGSVHGSRRMWEPRRDRAPTSGRPSPGGHPAAHLRFAATVASFWLAAAARFSASAARRLAAATSPSASRSLGGC